jgi:leader peptidase (prepilin peptidase)/N-methyltransferase
MADSSSASGYVLWVFFFVLGSAIGSFLNVCIHRLPREESIIHPRSHCPKCGATLSTVELVPILSYVLLGGKCRHCKARISPRYFLVELLCGLAFVGVWQGYGVRAQGAADFARLVASWVLAACLIGAFFTDIDTMIIPDEFTITPMLLGVAVDSYEIVSGVRPAVALLDPFSRWTLYLPGSIVGLVTGAAIFAFMEIFSQLVFKKEGMGGGDLKLAAAIGAMFGPGRLLVSTGMAVLAGALVGAGFLLARRRPAQGYMPFGPFIVIAAMAMLLWPEVLSALAARGWEVWRQLSFPNA